MAITISFAGKLALVTGGSKGIGLAIVKSLAEAGANVALTYSSTPPEEVNKLVSELQAAYPEVQIGAFPLVDGGSSAAYVKLLDAIEASDLTGELDIVVPNAGKSLHIEAEKMTDAELEGIFALNTFGPYYLLRECVNRWFAEGGKEAGKEVGWRREKGGLEGKVAVVISSISGHVAMTPQKQAAYNASKAAVTALTKSLAGEWAPQAFRLNCVSPGYVKTDMINHLDQAWVDVWKTKMPLGRMASAEEVARSVTMLCSEQFSYCTGSDVVVDGGYTIF